MMKALFSDIQHMHTNVLNGLEENAFTFTSENGISGNLTELKFNGVLIRKSDFVVSRPVRFEVETVAPSLEMHFALTGQVEVKNHSIKNPISISDMQHNIVGIPRFSGEYFFSKRDTRRSSLEILLTKDFFKGLVNESCSLQCALLENLDKGIMSFAGKHHLSITPQIQLILHNIIQCKRSGYLKKMYLEAKVIELLMLQTEAFETRFSSNDCNCLFSSKKDVEKIQAVKELINEEPNNAFTLNGLAKKTGLNTFKLKKGFKALYGQTVFGYINDLKMEKARQLLLDKNISVKEVAYLCGYNSPNNFSTAFKKKYGLSPNQLISSRKGNNYVL